ncbi:unnamed protein product [Orchesella dallaii]|uniref:Serine-threonine/tyrosine-protein kinase catalytic domain-containing protein n=1 Tax=Orchesella dallaii TaxID=48710 RepID=A0ABP1RIA2_9HEXA
MIVQDLIVVLTIFFAFHFSEQSEVVENIEFDKNFVGITFDHQISHLRDDPDAYSEQEIEVMLQVISKRFAHVIVTTPIEGPSDDGSTIQSAALIPIIAAKQNKLMKMSKIEFVPFNIKLTILLDPETGMPETRTEVDHALDLTLKANSIYPGTVSTLLLSTDDLDDEITQNMSIQVLSYIRKQNHTINQELQIGVWILETDCGALLDRYAPRYTQNVLQYADVVIFNDVPAKRQVELGAQIASQSVLQFFTECKARLRRTFPNNLIISWSSGSSPNDGKEHDLNYSIMYWKLLSDWAAKNKELLHFFEAFDTPMVDHHRSVDSQRGWWKLDFTNIINVTENSFVEKITLLSNEDDNEDSVLTIILIAISVTFILLLLVGVAIFILYRNVNNLKSQRLSKDDYEEFMEGSSISGVDGNGSEMLRLPYDKQQYELTKNSFTIGLSWSLSFVGELQKGLRLQRPQYSSEELYNLMVECWHPNPLDRASFTKLKQTLMNLDNNTTEFITKESEVVGSPIFDRNFIGIAFDPHVSHLSYALNGYSASEIEIEAMLKVISKRFSHVIVSPGIEAPSWDYSIIQIGTRTSVAAANQNKERNVSRSEFIPLNLKINVGLHSGSNQSKILSKVNNALYWASQANSIYPRTVSTLLLSTTDLEKQKTQETSILILKYIRNHTLGQELKIGLMIPVAHCGALQDTYAPKHTQNVLEHADLVIFYDEPPGLDAQVASQFMIKRFSECERKL